MENLTEKTWGTEELIVSTPLYTGKFLYVKPGFRCSTHMHPVKDETFLCLGGSGIVSVNGFPKPFFEGCKQRILPGDWHFFASEEGMTLLEVSTEHRDTDVERINESRALTVRDCYYFECLKENGNTDSEK